MKNKDKYNLAHLHIVERPGKTRLDYCFKYVEIEYSGKIIKEYSCLDEDVSKKFLEWLEEEYKPPILNDVEKAYLSAVIKPFRKRIEYIEKTDNYYVDGKQFLSIGLVTDDHCYLPFFKKGTMYKGMEANECYTLEELGL